MLSWHHLEELLSIADEAWARRRIEFIQSLPFVAYFRLPWDHEGLGSIVDVLSAETVAVLEGASDLISVRDRAKALLLRTGSGTEAIGGESWVWDVIRVGFLARREHAKLIMATTGLELFDENRTIGEISKGSIRPAAELREQASNVRDRIRAHIEARGDREIADHGAVAADFMGAVMEFVPPEGMTVRELLVLALTSQGVDEGEIGDDCLLCDLSKLAVHRSKLRVIAEKTGYSFARLKAVDMRLLPSWQLEEAFKRYGQDRPRRSGSDLVDGYLSSLAPYVQELYVDKRTAEDFRRMRANMPIFGSLIAHISKASDFIGLAA
jgi:hypothetical protein